MLAAVADGNDGATDLPAVAGLLQTLTKVQQLGYGDDDIAAAALPEL